MSGCCAFFNIINLFFWGGGALIKGHSMCSTSKVNMLKYLQVIHSKL